MLNQDNFNKFITELKKRLTAKDPSCILTYYQQLQGNIPTGAIIVRIDVDNSTDHYIIENSIFGARWFCLYNF